MACNYFEYKNMTDKMFDGVVFTDEYLSNVTERIMQYLINGGARNIVYALHIGIKVVTKSSCFPVLSQVVEKRFVWLDGERKGEELTIDEIKGIGMFLKHGALYGKIRMEENVSSSV